MKQYFGILEIGAIENEQTGNETTEDLVLEENSVRFVHYPDCQQLIIWLPYYGYNYGVMRLLDTDTRKVVDERPTTDRLNGSIQLLWDTLEIAPGNYCIEINCNNGWQHRIYFKKYKKGIVPPPKEMPVVPTETQGKSDEPIVYRDGTGKILPNEDLILREQIFKSLEDRFLRKIRYEGTFRAGTIIYMEGNLEISFWHEMGGGNCMFYIDIPTQKDWEARTKTPLERREDIVQFVAMQVKKEQASNTRVDISEDTITYYYQ